VNRVQKGQPLRIKAADWNAAQDAAADLAARRNTFGRDWQATFKQTGIVRIRNDSGYDRDRFNVLGIDDTVIKPDENLEEFKNRIALIGVEPKDPDHVGRFAVLLEPIPAGAIGMGVVAGVTVVQVDVQDEDDTFAEIADGVVDNLKSGQAGSALILYKETGTGVKWAVVRLGNPATGLLWGKAVSNWHNAAGNDSYVDVHPCDDKDGANPDESTTVRVYLPRSGLKDHPEGTEDPNVIGGAVIPFEYDANGDAICVGTFLDGVIDKTVQLWIGDPANIDTERPGWADAGYGTYFPVGYAEGDPDYGSIGATGGYKWHGQTENNHPNHNLSHSHPIYVCSPGNQENDYPTGVFDHFTLDAQWADPHHSEHSGPYNNGDTDNRPPWKVLFYIKRIDNSA